MVKLNLTVQGHELTLEQSEAVYVSIRAFMFQLNDPNFVVKLGLRASNHYRWRLSEVLHLIDQ